MIEPTRRYRVTSRWRADLLTALVLLLSAGSIECSSSRSQQAPGYDLEFEQFGESIAIGNGVVRLAPDEFAFLFTLSGPDALLVHTSFSSETYDSARSGAPLTSLRGFTETAMAEYGQNANRILPVRRYAPAYWYYETDEKNRFDQIELLDDGRIRCRRTVRTVWDYDVDRETDVRDLQRVLYITIVQSEWKNGERVETGGRRAVRIIFD